MSLVRFVVLVVILAVLVAAAKSAATRPPEKRCQSIDAERLSVEKLETLRDASWYSDADDGYERLYSPGCLAPGSGV